MTLLPCSMCCFVTTSCIPWPTERCHSYLRPLAVGGFTCIILMRWPTDSTPISRKWLSSTKPWQQQDITSERGGEWTALHQLLLRYMMLFEGIRILCEIYTYSWSAGVGALSTRRIGSAHGTNCSSPIVVNQSLMFPAFFFSWIEIARASCDCCPGLPMESNSANSAW